MRNRWMRVIVFFDLPMVEAKDRKKYVKFRKFLINEGFLMMQQSVYSKLALNLASSNAICRRVRKNNPNSGLVQVLIITEKQYSRIEYISGSSQTTTKNDTERLVII